MTDLVNRDWLIRVDGLEFSELDCKFEVEKSLRPEPNKCSLTIYNLSDEHRSQIEQGNIYDPKRIKGVKQPAQRKVAAGTPKVGHIRVEIEAGYKTTGRHLIFRGDLRRALSSDDGTTTETKIEGEDGGRSILASRVSQSFPKGTPRIAVVKACAEAMGLGLGNLVAIAGKPAFQQPYTAGTVLHGQASAELSGVLRGARCTYSVQNGVLAFRDLDAGLTTTAFLLNSQTGMVGSPERDAAGMVVVTCLLLPTIAPGGYVQLEAKNTSGVFKIQKVTYSCDTSGQEWYAKLELVPG